MSGDAFRGSTTRADATGLPSISPPTTSQRPSGSRVRVWPGGSAGWGAARSSTSGAPRVPSGDIPIASAQSAAAHDPAHRYRAAVLVSLSGFESSLSYGLVTFTLNVPVFMSFGSIFT